MKISFHSNQLGVRGTEISLFDYAYNNREILGNESIIVSDKKADLSAYDKFHKEFEVILYDKFEEVIPILHSKKVDIAYFIKAGDNDGKIIPDIKNVIHSVFQTKDPHGDVYAYVSEWLSKKMSNNEIPFVPHMIDILRFNHNMNYREFLGIPKDALVFGYYGGSDQFDIKFVKKAICDIANKNNNIYFIFMNIQKFCNETDNIIFLNATTDIETKIGFINTCDACLHGRSMGESFGLTIAEFSTKNKPIITKSTKLTPWCDNAHIEFLGDTAILYDDYDDIYNIITNFSDIINTKQDWNCYKDYTPEKVMKIFNEVFIK